jgi:tRNA(Ile)-lysidine synthase
VTARPTLPKAHLQKPHFVILSAAKNPALCGFDNRVAGFFPYGTTRRGSAIMISMSRITHVVERAIASALANNGVGRDARMLVALSGGADSVALLHALHRLGELDQNRRDYLLTAAHFNHQLRGDESNRDEQFVRDLCQRLNIELIVERTDRLHGSANLEERARDLRCDFLNRAADRTGARWIAMAHHTDDQAETVMMRLLRGSGAAGLAAMSPAGPGRIVRPMLTLRRGQILAYLDAIGEPYATDSSNLSPAILRNRVRRELLPMLEREYAPGFSRRLVGLADEMRSLNDYLESAAGDELRRRQGSPSRFDLTGFAELHPALAKAMLRGWLRAQRGNLRRIYRQDIERMYRLCANAAPGSVAELTGGWRLRCEYGAAVLERHVAAQPSPFAVELACPGVTEVPASGFTLTARMLRPGDACFPREPSMPTANQMEAFFDAAEIEGQLVVRGFRRGDRVQPLGMTGTRKVHDVFTDRKVPRERRATWPIVESCERILWIPGMVRSRCALVTATTRNLLQLKAHQEASNKDTSLLGN